MPAGPKGRRARRLLVVEYNGAPYVGWQAQAGQPSVEQALCLALSAVTGEPEGTHELAVAGRTDRGVHARGQRASFVTLDAREPRRFAPALNHVLPASIRVHHCAAVDEDFDVRRAARGKWYRYQVALVRHRSVLQADRAWLVQKRTELGLATRAAEALLGEHDFNAFRSVHCDASHARRRLDVACLRVEAAPPIGRLVTIDLIGNAFCRHMCRILAGTLIDIATGDRPPDAILRALKSGRRADAGQTAPAHALTLMDVAYPSDCSPTGWPVGWPVS